MTRSASPSAASTAFESPAGATSRGRPTPALLKSLSREPFVHFALLGALVFAGDRLIAPQAEERVILVSTAKQLELTTLFEQRQQRAPSPDERQQLIQRHVEDEVLVREGLRLGLAETDPMLRAQLVARLRGILQSGLAPSEPSDDELGRYYDEHQADYDLPETIRYREYWIHRGPDAGSDARRLLDALRAEKEPEAGLPEPIDHVGRSEAQLVSLYDEELARSLWALPAGTWHELRSERGIHIVRVEDHTPARQRTVAELRARLSADYQREQIAGALQAEIGRLAAGWRVQVDEVAAPQ